MNDGFLNHNIIVGCDKNRVLKLHLRGDHASIVCRSNGTQANNVHNAMQADILISN